MKKIVFFILIVFVAYLLYTGVKSVILLRQGVHLLETTKYPSIYKINSTNYEKRKVTYLVLGDSTAVGVGSSNHENSYSYQVAQKLARNGFSVEVINIAKSGSRVSDVVSEQLPKIKEINPNIISISIGGNDATHMTSEDDFKKNMRSIVEEIEESDAKIVLFGSTPNMFRIPALPRWFSWLAGKKSERQNEVTKSILPSSFHYIDIFNNARLQGIKEYAVDWFHPNDRGYEKWAREFTNELETEELN